MKLFRDFLLRTIVLLLAFVLTSGCFSLPRLVTLIYEGDEGTVFLKEFQHSSPQADHPAYLESQVVRRILLGVRVYERKTFVESTLTGGGDDTPVFTSAEVNFLTPLLVSAFNQATPQEAVHFKVTGDVSGRRFDTGGIMFIKEERLSFSLSEYGLTPQRRSTLSQPTKSFDRPKRYSVTFTPISAVLNAEEDNQVVGDQNFQKPLLISLKVLKQHTDWFSEEDEEEVMPSQSVETDSAGQTPEEMEKEIERLRKSMKEQEERLKRLERQMDK